MKYFYGDGGEEGQRKTEKRGSTIFYILLLCAAAVSAVMIKNVCISAAIPLPKGIERLSTDSESYEKALRTLGKAVSGEKSLSAAISEACQHAFGGGSTEIPAATDSVGDVYTISYPAKAAEESGAVWTAASVPSEEFTFDEAAVASFTESQQKYIDRAGMPASVTFDMPPVECDCICPVMGCVSSAFGYRNHPVDGVLRFHYGTDIAADKGTEVSVFADGTVTSSGDSSSYGLYVIVDHGEGVVSLYAHMSSVNVSVGDKLTMGDTVGTVGSTGNATGPCLHFEIRVDGHYVNPEYYVSWT